MHEVIRDRDLKKSLAIHIMDSRQTYSWQCLMGNIHISKFHHAERVLDVHIYVASSPD